MTYICGEDFCEYCGDCMACYGGDDCLFSPDGKHYYFRDEKEEEKEEEGNKKI